MGKSVKNMFQVFVASPKLSLMDSLNALRKGTQGMTPIKDTSRALAKSADHHIGAAIVQEHGRSRRVRRVTQALQNVKTGERAVLKVGTD